MRKDLVPRPYQQLIIDHVVDNPRCAIWADMGMGKTSSTYLALEALSLGEDVYPALVLAPLIVARDTWPDEAAKWHQFKNLRVLPVIGDAAHRRFQLNQRARIYTINYDNLPWLVEYLGDRWNFRTVIADEARRLKSLRVGGSKPKKDGTPKKSPGGGGKRAMALAQVAHLRVKRFIELTGAPAPNGLTDLWGQAWFLDAGQRLGRTYGDFQKRWFRKSYDGYGSDPQGFAADQIQDRLRDLCLRVDAADWLDLTQPIRLRHEVDLPSSARGKYKELKRELEARFNEKMVTATNAAALTQKLLQLCNGAVYLDPAVEGEESPGPREWAEVHDVKTQKLDSIVNELNGEPLLVAYHFKSDLARLRKAFPKARVLKDRKQLAEFKTGAYEVGLGHPASIGHGTDGLQEHCRNVAFYGHWWDMDQRDQFIARVGNVRQYQAGKTEPMYIHDIVMRDTVDEDVLYRHETKATVQNALLHGMKRS